MKRYLCALAVTLAGCNQGPVTIGPDENPAASTVNLSASTPGTGGSADAAGPEAVNLTLEQCGMSARWQDITEEVDGLNVTITVYYGGEDLILYVWLPRVNDGDQKGPFPFINGVAVATFAVPTYGVYQYQLAVEQDLTGDGRADRGCQDDRYHSSFETRPPHAPPPPPDPGCDVEALIRDAVLECGEAGFSIDAEQCTFECQPPPIPPPCPYNPQIPITDPACVPPPELCDIPGLEGLPADDPSCVPPPECEFGEAYLDEGLNWVCPEPPPTDVCPNIEGIQETVPEGLVVDDAGNCVEPEVEHGQCFYEVAVPPDEREALCNEAGGVFGEHDQSAHAYLIFPAFPWTVSILPQG